MHEFFLFNLVLVLLLGILIILDTVEPKHQAKQVLFLQDVPYIHDEDLIIIGLCHDCAQAESVHGRPFRYFTQVINVEDLNLLMHVLVIIYLDRVSWDSQGFSIIIELGMMVVLVDIVC